MNINDIIDDIFSDDLDDFENDVLIDNSPAEAAKEEVSIELMYRDNEPVFSAVSHDMVKAGWSIFPQENNIKRQPGMIAGSMIKWSEDHKLSERLPTEKELNIWNEYCSSLNVAVVLGAGSGNAFVLDVDIVDEDFSLAVQDIADDILGHTTLRRVGNWPKIALVYRAAEGEEIPSKSPKFVKMEKADGSIEDDMGLEIISTGKPMTFYGKHYKTGSYFNWLEGSPQFIGPKDVPEVTLKQLSKFMEEVEKIRPFARSDSFETGDEITWEWDETNKINVPRILSSSIQDWTEDKEGKVIDGREAYLTSLAFRVVVSNPQAAMSDSGRETLIKVVLKRFSETALMTGRWKGRSLENEVRSRVVRTANRIKTGSVVAFEPKKNEAGEYVNNANKKSYTPAQPRNENGDSLDFLPDFVDPTDPLFVPNRPNQRRAVRIDVDKFNNNGLQERAIEEDRTRIAMSVSENLLKAFQTFWDEVYSNEYTHPRIHILKAPTGAGKTSRGIQFIAEDERTKDDFPIYNEEGKRLNEGRAPILFLLPTYDNIEELRSRSMVLNLDPTLSDSELRAQAEEHGLIQADEMKGKLDELRRSAKNAGLTTMLYEGKLKAGCQMVDKMKMAMEAGMGTSRLCKADVPTGDRDENNKPIMTEVYCPFYDNCKAIQQKFEIERSHVVFMPHAFLALNIPDELKHVRAVVADERIHHLFLHTATLDLDIFNTARKAPKLTKKEKAAEIDPSEFNPLRMKAANVVVKALKDKRCPADALLENKKRIPVRLDQKGFLEESLLEVETWVDAALRTCGASMQRDGDITPEISMDDLSDICSQPTGVQVREEYRFWKILKERMQLRKQDMAHEGMRGYEKKAKGEKDYRLQLVEDTLANGSVKQMIRLSWREVPNWVDRPMLLLDASAAPDMISKIWSGKEVVTHDIPAALNVRTVCIADRTYSNSSVVAAPSASPEEKLMSTRLLSDVRKAITTISAMYGYSRVVAGGSILVRRAVNTAWEGPHNVDWCHFGAMRGLDFAKHHAAAISVGRMELPVRTLDGLVAALTYDDDQPEQPFDLFGNGLNMDKLTLRIPMENQMIKMRSGHDVTLPVPMFPGKWGRMIQRQYREEELLQFLGRLRPVYREGMAPVWFSLSSVIPEEVIVDDIINLDDLIRPSTIIWDAMRRCSGVLETEMVSRVCNDMFSSQDRVSLFMQQAGMNSTTGEIEKRISWGIASYKYTTDTGHSSVVFIRGDIANHENYIKTILKEHLDRNVTYVELISASKDQTLARERKIDKIEIELGTMEERQEREFLNQIQTAIKVLMHTPAEAIKHMREDSGKIVMLPLSIPSGVKRTSGGEESKEYDVYYNILEADVSSSIETMWDKIKSNSVVEKVREDKPKDNIVEEKVNAPFNAENVSYDYDDFEIPF